MYGIYTNIGGIVMVNVTIYTIHGSYGDGKSSCSSVKSPPLFMSRPLFGAREADLPRDRSAQGQLIHWWVLTCKKRLIADRDGKPTKQGTVEFTSTSYQQDFL